MDKTQIFIDSVDEFPQDIKARTSDNKVSLPMHKHAKAQLSYAEGDATFIFTNENEYLLPARHYVWIPGGVEHRLLHKYRTYNIYTFYIPEILIPDNPFYKQTGVYPVNSLLLEMIIYSKRWQGDISKKSFGYQFISTLVRLLAETESQKLPISLPTTNNPRLSEILSYLQSNLHKKLTIEFVSKKFNYSERTFSRTFHTLLGLSFFQYLKSARVIRAMEMLLRTDKNVSEIAFETGYESIAAFSNSFQSLSGMRPSDFRSLNK